MTTYTSAGFEFTCIAKKNSWHLFKGTRDGSYYTYELVKIVAGKFPTNKEWGEKGFSFLSLEDGLRAMKMLTEKGA